ncbi:YybH family protein [Paludisphaera soli]|uniref:YybH family protein n=1 Tax=Paludisphaera soli TaxID=2712865 RepID=UPI0013EB7056|nr:nuclear transport factor 2 family protein [Paludisphaera soli]
MTKSSPRWLGLVGLGLILASRTAPAQDLERLKYNNPGLVVDLGVGLWAWPLPMDFDGDGDLDLVVNCPDKPYNGVYFFENADGPTSKVKSPVFKPGRRISKGLQNVQVSYVDGRPRVLSPGTEHPDFLKTGLERGTPLPLPANVHPNRVRGNFWRYVDYDGDGKLDVVVGADDWTDYGWDNAYDPTGKWTRGPLRGFVYVARNIGESDAPKYEDPTRVMVGDKPLEVFGWPSPNFADFDDDGDLDLVCGEFLDGFTYFENVGSRTKPEYAAGRRLKQGDGSPLVMDLEMITPTAIDWDGDGDLDLIVGDEDGRVALVENAGGLADDRTPRFLAPVYFRQEADDVKFGALATPFGFDWDGDGDFDIVSGNTAGYIAFVENLSGPGVAKPKWAAPKLLEADGRTIRILAGPNGSIQGPCEAKWGYTTLTVADWDGDELPDLIVNSILGRVHWYKNVGARTEPKLAAARPVEVAWTPEHPQPNLSWGWLRPDGDALLTQWRTTPVAVDWNRDGLVDLVMLDQDGYLAFFERARKDGALVLLPPRRAFRNDSGEPLRLNAKSAGGSGRRKLCVVDWDRDGKLDLLLNAANALLYRQEGEADGGWTFRNVGLLSNRNIEGHDVSPTVVDFDADGVPDFLGGAEDGRFYYLANPAAKDKTFMPAVEGDPAHDVREVLARQEAAWNAGDLDGFLTTYWDSPELVFQSGGARTEGFRATRDRYQARYKAEGRAMGKLAFSGLEVSTLGPDAALARGGWRLVLPDGAEPSGLFTLILRRFPEGWKIVHDHTSAADPEPTRNP